MADARPARLAVLLSGQGSNLQAILDAIEAGTLTAEVVLVVSNRRQAYGLERAAQRQIPTLYCPLKPYSDAGQPRSAYDADLAARIEPYAPDLLVLAGWMHIFTAAFLDHFPNRVINLHPALPGQLPGAHAIADAFARFQQGEIDHSGCMVHYVIPEVDAGPVIATATVPFMPEDTLEVFAARMHAAEHGLIVEAISRTTTDSGEQRISLFADQ